MDAKKSNIIKRTKILSIFLLGVLIVSIIPIIYLGKYAHSVMDDFSYGTIISEGIRAGKSIIVSILDGIKMYYFGWQGTYSAIATMALVPSVWNENYYIFTPVIMLVSIIFSTQTSHLNKCLCTLKIQ